MKLEKRDTEIQQAYDNCMEGIKASNKSIERYKELIIIEELHIKSLKTVINVCELRAKALKIKL